MPLQRATDSGDEKLGISGNLHQFSKKGRINGSCNDMKSCCRILLNIAFLMLGSFAKGELRLPDKVSDAYQAALDDLHAGKDPVVNGSCYMK